MTHEASYCIVPLCFERVLFLVFSNIGFCRVLFLFRSSSPLSVTLCLFYFAFSMFLSMPVRVCIVPLDKQCLRLSCITLSCLCPPGCFTRGYRALRSILPASLFITYRWARLSTHQLKGTTVQSVLRCALWQCDHRMCVVTWAGSVGSHMQQHVRLLWASPRPSAVSWLTLCTSETSSDMLAILVPRTWLSSVCVATRVFRPAGRTCGSLSLPVDLSRKCARSPIHELSSHAKSTWKVFTS